MSQINELQARITAALDRIAQGLEGRPAAAPEAVGDPEELTKLRGQLEEEQLANAQLQERIKALHAKQVAGVVEPHLINKAMMAELEGLRAARGADRGEVEAVLAALGQVIAEAGAAPEQTEKTETSDA